MLSPLLACVLLAAQTAPDSPRLAPGSWRATLTTPGGPLAFGLDFELPAADLWRVFLVNGAERIEVPHVVYDGNDLLLDLPHYDSRIRARLVTDPLGFEGTWEKRRGKDSVATLPFRAFPPSMQGTPGPSAERYLGRWRVDFADEQEDAVAVFSAAPRGRVRGTFLTTTGDYRYLAGSVGDGLTLSCFDGAHAFLFRAQPTEEGTLRGDFWSGDWYHDTWTAVRDDGATLPDAFEQTSWNGMTRLSDLRFPDLDGVERSLGDLAGKATLLVVFGSWCPNCNDEAELLAELDARYRSRGLVILGLAFELTGEPARDATQVRLFAERHALRIPLFLCGTADKDEATRALGLVDRVRAFPTTVFVDAHGLPKAIHSGFAGPATGEAHLALRRAFEERLEALLGPP